MSQAGIMGVKGGGSALVETLTGNSGGAVGPTGNNINIVGTGAVTVTGNSGTSTLTISNSGAVAISFATDSGTATPSAGVITFNAVSQAGSTVVFSGSGSTVRLNTSDGYSNTFVGNTAGNPSITVGVGINNSGFGELALNSITTGQFNNAFGQGALDTLTSGSHNCAFGDDNSSDMTSASFNCAFGNGSLAEIVGSSSNVAMGYESLARATSAANNVAIGYRAGTASASGLLTGTNNILIGYESANAFTSSESSNIIIGNAGIVGDANTIRIGVHGNGTGQQYKTYIASCYSNYGSFNTFVGEQTGNTTFTTANAINNTAIGNLSLNQIVGAGALQGLSNTALGSTSLSSLTNGSNNTCAGNFSGGLITTGNWNCIIGNNSGSDYTSSESSNIILGSSLGTVGESNVMRLGGGTGSGIAQQNTTYISGINGNTVSNAVMVTIDSATDQLGTASMPSSSITITGDSGGGLTGNSFTFTGGTSGLTFAGSGTTETLGGTLAIANGGTNATSMATSTGIVKYDGTRLVTSSTAKIDSSNRMTNTSQPAFSVYPSATLSNVTGDGTTYTIIMNTALFDQNSNWNTGTGTFTAPITGRYLLGFTIYVSYSSGAPTNQNLSIVTTAYTYQMGVDNPTYINISGNYQIVGQTIAPMSANDTATFQLTISGTTKTMGLIGGSSPIKCNIYGYLVC